jgi:hypothetical protein
MTIWSPFFFYIIEKILIMGVIFGIVIITDLSRRVFST